MEQITGLTITEHNNSKRIINIKDGLIESDTKI